jgi:hypothetical protein
MYAYASTKKAFVALNEKILFSLLVVFENESTI